ncbi:basic helix-loop-helix (bHLH) DNA-binding superfamily protein [Actinidia rufa]|uniref:Basic helix-loop-helix (BHLH) DNA-binding superfamily protein n=1 Tax=Actinidia rufa TaxID=165716 RepID=A0A7J0E8I5_9ERIC|nr:basic helix-loop-helix (bHLH) DNA-binding superfamily protein [Actinidia rufa]
MSPPFMPFSCALPLYFLVVPLRVQLSLQAEKNELCEEKLVLKEEKERTEQRLKAMTASLAGFLPPHPAAAYHAGVNKMAVFPSYGYVPMWQYLPPATLDTSKDQELRPPAA